MFKKGDVVRYHNSSDIGTVEGSVEHFPNHVWVNWTHGDDAGEMLHCDVETLSLHFPNENIAENFLTEFSVKELKKLLDKMDDNIVFSFSDLKIHFNQKVA